MKFVFFVKSWLIFNVFYCFTHKRYGKITREFVHTEMNIYSNEIYIFDCDYSFQCVLILIYRETFKFLLAYLMTKTCVTSLVFKK